MKIAVTGASGFLGRHVTTELLRRGIHPVLVTRDSSSLAELQSCATIVQLDLHAPPQDSFGALGQPDILIHLAWQGVRDYHAPQHLATELPAHAGFLQSLIAAGLRTLAVAGTCLEYGTTCGLKTESMLAEPATAYASAKHALHDCLKLQQLSSSFNLVWHRLFYLYGPGQSPAALLPQLQRAIARGETSFNMSGGEQIRDFHHVATAASEIVGLALKQQPFGIVNGCSGQPTSVRTFVERYLAANNLSIKLNLGYYPYSSHEPFDFWGSTSYLQHCLAS
jgi:nucleoside-diphosphate-sugar epimerase